MTAAVVAQEPDGAKLRRDLGGTDAQAVAWAAHHSRLRRDKQMVAPLQRALGSWRRREHGDSRRVCLHLLDALVAHDAKVPAGELMDLVDSELCGAAAFVLLVREHRTSQAELQTLFQRDLEHFPPDTATGSDPLAEQRERRTAILGDVLAWHSPPGFVACVAPRCDWTLRVIVRDSGKSTPRGPFAPTGPRLEASGAAWPPRPAYWLDHPHAPRAQVQRIPVVPMLDHAITREERTDDAPAEGMWSFSLSAGEPPRMPKAVQWLVVAGSAEHPRLRLEIPYDTDAAFVTAATAARERVQSCVDSLRRHFVSRGELTAAAAAKWLPARVEVEVQDRRAGAGSPLPALPAPK